MHTQEQVYYDAAEPLHGFVAYDATTNKPRPAVLIAHDWSGRNDFACDKAKLLADMGYVGFALDMYGHGKLGTTDAEKSALIQPLLNDRAKLLSRLRAGLDALVALPQVDKNRIAIIGFCFGGLCALDLARSGAAIVGAISFHGLLNKPDKLKPQPIRSKVLVLHGYNDPMVEPPLLQAFCEEMTKAEVDWQVHAYGQVQHAFTNPNAHDAAAGLMYNAQAAKRAWLAMRNFLDEVF
jgi:dienelactone hydrolase